MSTELDHPPYGDPSIPEPTFEDRIAALGGPDNLWKPSSTVIPVKQVPSDDIGFQTIAVLDQNTANPQPATLLKNKQPQGVASRYTITIAAIAGALGRVFLLRSRDEQGTIVTDGSGAPYAAQGFYLGLASEHASFTVASVAPIYVVSYAAAIGNGALVSVVSEVYFAE